MSALTTLLAFLMAIVLGHAPVVNSRADVQPARIETAAESRDVSVACADVPPADEPTFTADDDNERELEDDLKTFVVDGSAAHHGVDVPVRLDRVVTVLDPGSVVVLRRTALPVRAPRGPPRA